MTDCVGLLPLLKITLHVAMENMYYHIAQTGLFLDNFFHIFGIPINNLEPMKSSLGY